VTPNTKNLLVRIATAVVGLPVVGAFVFWPDPRGLGALCLLVAALSLVEYVGLTLRGRPLAERFGTVLVGCALFLALVIRPAQGLVWLLGSVVAIALLFLPTASQPQSAWTRLTAAGFGVFYVGGLLAAVPILHGSLGPAWVALVVALSFGNDTGAYFAGRGFGKHKLAPAISPGKTIEGALGGLVANLVIVAVAKAFFMTELTVRDVVMLAVPAAIVGPAGDLVESLLKRAAGAKDSGRLLPGHGGILDRIDALLFVGAYVCIYALQLR
jgi:phosphatidate cytidylyltransferase